MKNTTRYIPIFGRPIAAEILTQKLFWGVNAHLRNDEGVRD
jgi:hypothetical protein